VMNFIKRHPIFVICAAAWLAIAARGYSAGEDCTWDGSESVLWSTDANWDVNHTPGDTDTVICTGDVANNCSTDVIVSIAKLTIVDDFADDFLTNPAQACTVSGAVSLDGTGNAIKLRNTFVQDADGDFVFNAGPTYDATSLLSFDLDLQGTGNLTNNSGANRTVHKISAAGAGKTTTHTGANYLFTKQLTFGSGTFTNNKNFGADITAIDDLNFHADHTINGNAEFTIYAHTASTTYNIPKINASGFTGAFYIGAKAGGTTFEHQGDASFGGVFWILKHPTGTGAMTVNTNDHTITAANCGWGSGKSGSALTVNLGAGVLDIAGYFQTTTWNSATATMNASSSAWTIGGDFDLGTNTAWVPGTEVLTYNGTTACTPTFAGETVADIVIAKTGGGWTAQDNVSCADFTVDAANDQAVSLNGHTLTASGNVTWDGSGTANLGNGVTLNGASSQYHLGSTLGAVTAGSCVLTFNTVTAGVLDADKILSNAKQLVLGASAILTSSGAATTYLSNSSGPGLVVGNNATLTLNRACVFYAFPDGDVYTIGTGVTLNGTADWYITPKRDNVAITMPALTYTGTGIFNIFEISASYNWTVTMTGAVNVKELRLRRYGATKSGTFNQGGFALTCTDFSYGCGHATGTFTGNFDGPITVSGATNPILYNLGTITINDSATWSVGGNVTALSTATYNLTAPTTAITGTSTLTSNGKTWAGAITVNSAGATTTTLADALVCGNFTLTDGAFDLNSQTLSCADITITSPDAKTFDAAVTATGNGDYNVAVTFNRLILTAATTHTFKSGEAITLENYTNGDWDDTILVSDTPGSHWDFVNPAGMVVVGINVTDSYATNSINASDPTNTDSGGNNALWVFGPTFEQTSSIVNFEALSHTVSTGGGHTHTAGIVEFVSNNHEASGGTSYEHTIKVIELIQGIHSATTGASFSSSTEILLFTARSHTAATSGGVAHGVTLAEFIPGTHTISTGTSYDHSISIVVFQPLSHVISTGGGYSHSSSIAEFVLGSHNIETGVCYDQSIKIIEFESLSHKADIVEFVTTTSVILFVSGSHIISTGTAYDHSITTILFEIGDHSGCAFSSSSSIIEFVSGTHSIASGGGYTQSLEAIIFVTGNQVISIIVPPSPPSPPSPTRPNKYYAPPRIRGNYVAPPRI